MKHLKKSLVNFEIGTLSTEKKKIINSLQKLDTVVIFKSCTCFSFLHRWIV